MKTYHQTDELIHALSQIIAKFNRTFVPEEADDSHTNFYFDELSGRLYGRWAEIGNHWYLLAINLANKEVELIDEYRNVQSLAKIEAYASINDFEDAVSSELSNYGLNADDLTAPMHFEIPEYDQIGERMNNIDDEAVELWTHIRGLANRASQKMLGHVQGSSELRIWPHHFDTGVYTELNEKLGLGFGLAMKDAMVGEAYFYYAAYGLNDFKPDYSKVSGLTSGKWIVLENWKGAVLPISAFSDGEESVVDTFIQKVTEQYSSML